METHEKALHDGPRDLGDTRRALERNIERETRGKERRRIQEISALALGRMTSALPDWVWDDPEILQDICESPLLFDYLATTSLRNRVDRLFGYGEHWLPSFPTRPIRPYVVANPIPTLSNGLLSLPEGRSDLIYHESFLPHVEMASTVRLSRRHKKEVTRERALLVVEEFLRDGMITTTGREEMRRYFGSRADGQARFAPPVAFVIWLALTKLSREIAPMRYFFSTSPDEWSFCGWDGVTWTFFDGRCSNSKGERISSGDRIILCEGTYLTGK